VPVAFSFRGCAEGLEPEVTRIARIELHAPSGGTGVKTELAIACDGDEVTLAVDDPITGKHVDRVVSVAGVEARDRGRLLALAIAELARSSWIELEVHAEPVLPLARPVAVSTEQRERARELAAFERRAPRWHAIAELEALEYPEVGRPLFGLSLAGQVDLASRFYAELALSGWDGAGERNAGSVAVRQIAFDPTLGVHLGVVDLGFGVRLGWASLSGSPASSAFLGGTTSGVVAGLVASGSVRLVGPLRLWLKLGGLLRGESGAVAGDGAVTAGGVFGSLGLGVRLGP